jgi:hypothetical protein
MTEDGDGRGFPAQGVFWSHSKHVSGKMNAKVDSEPPWDVTSRTATSGGFDGIVSDRLNGTEVLTKGLRQTGQRYGIHN